MEVQEGQGCFFCLFAALFFVISLLTFPVGILIWVILYFIYKNSQRS